MPSSDPPSLAWRGVFRIVLAYAFFAGLWILLSDRLMGLMITDPEQLVQASMVKGWLFVIVTSLLLYVLVQRFVSQLQAGHENEIHRERERQRALQMLSAIAESSEDAIFAKDAEGRYLLFNPAAARFVGKAAEAVLGHDDRAIFPPEQAGMLKAVSRRVMETGRIETHEEVLETAAGTKVFLTTKGPLRDAGGRIAGTFGISRDITERKRAEEALRESETRFRALVEQSLAGIYIIQDGRFRYVNPGFAAIFGYVSAADIVAGVSVADLVASGDRARVANNILRRVEGETDDIHYTFLGLRRDGSLIDVEVHGRRFDYEGRPAVIGIILDITARKAAEDALRESELRFHDIVKATADWVWEVDAEARYTYASESVHDFLGYTPQEILGKTPFDLMPPDEAARVGKLFAGIVARRESFRDLDNLNVRKDGSMVQVSTNGMPILDPDGRLMGYRGLDRDITEQKRAELELRTRNEELERFNRASVERELDMIELKRKVNVLAHDLGRPPPYDLSFVDQDDGAPQP